MTHLEPEDILRRALHAVAESVEPATEGLTQIRARLSTPRPLAVAWLLAAWETASQFVMLRLEATLDWLANSLHTALRTADGLLYPAAERLRPLTERLGPVTERLRPALAAAVAWARRVIQPPQAGSEERRSRYAWVRPAVAMAAVVLVAVVGGFALSGRLNQISQAASSVFSSSSTHGSGGRTHHSGVSGSGGTHPQPSSAPSGNNGTAPSPSPSCRPPTAQPKPHPTATPTPTQTPTQSASPSPPATTPPTTPPPTTPPPSSPPPTAGPEQSASPASSASATQVAHDSAVVIIGARSGSAAMANPTPSPTCSSGG